jgi:predicted N-acetyltransferase YhbS
MPRNWTDAQRRHLEDVGYEAVEQTGHVTRYEKTGYAPRSNNFQEAPLGLGFTCLTCGCHVAREFTRRHRERCTA